jgi:putative effector of murein hydrolase LrgA (UPF0299 family)
LKIVLKYQVGFNRKERKDLRKVAKLFIKLCGCFFAPFAVSVLKSYHLSKSQ